MKVPSLLLISTLSAMALASAACSQETTASESERPSAQAIRQAISSTNKVLILGSTVSGGSLSPEALAATSLGYTVEIASDAAWSAKTLEEFASYRALILGDPFCSGVQSAAAAIDNRNVWGPIVDGNVILVGTDPVWHDKTTVTNNSVGFAAAQAGKTGMYISLSCYYHAAPPGTPVPLLDQFGSFTATGVGCYNNAHIVATHPALDSLTDAYLSNWSCSVHEALDGYPAANFTPLAIALDPSPTSRLPGSRDFADGTHGVPYILARGVTPVLCGDGEIQAPEECDMGEGNGVPGNLCSATCHLHWCGDATVDSGEDCDDGASNGTSGCSTSCKFVAACGNGIVEPGEECDEGANNGTGSCSTTCRLVVVSHPPTARCQDLHLSADEACGANGSIDNGSSDPDGDLVGCTQSPAGPYPLGETHVMLICTDSTGTTSTCVSHVEVDDHTQPALVCPGNTSAECVGGVATVDPGTATATDNCGVDMVSAPGLGTFPLGTTPVTYVAADTSGNTSVCTSQVTVADTLAPSIAMRPGPSVLSCNTAYDDPGATASDACEGDLTSSIIVSSNVDTSHPGHYAVTYRVADSAGHTTTASRELMVEGTPLHLSDYNLFLLENYSGGHDVQGKVAAGGAITMTDFAVGSGLPASDLSKVLVAGGNLTLSQGAVWGDAFHAGAYSANQSVHYPRGSVAAGAPIDFAARFAELRSLSAKLDSMRANGSAARESWGGIMLRGTNPELNVFRVDASVFTGAKLLSIDAPAGSLVVVNIHGSSATFTGFGHAFSGGINQRGVLYNFVDTTTINAYGFGFWGTVLAPNAHIDFHEGSFDGGIYARSLTGNAEGHINPLAGRSICP
jgi:choice-of-anchor A domain-containing protein